MWAGRCDDPREDMMLACSVDRGRARIAGGYQDAGARDGVFDRLLWRRGGLAEGY